MSTLQSNVSSSLSLASPSSSLPSRPSDESFSPGLSVAARFENEVDAIQEELAELNSTGEVSSEHTARVELLAELMVEAHSLGTDFVKLRAMLRNLDSKNPETRCQAVKSIGPLTTTSANLALLIASYDSSEKVREEACKALSTRKDDRIGQRLAEVLGDPQENRTVRREAAHGLRDQSSRIAIPAIRAAINDSTVADVAVSSLSGHKNDASLSILKMVIEKNNVVKEKAYQALGRHDTVPAAEALLEYLASPERENWVSALLALESHTHSTAFEGLSEYARKAVPAAGMLTVEKENAIARALGRMRPAEPPDIAALKNTLGQRLLSLREIKETEIEIAALRDDQIPGRDELLEFAARHWHEHIREKAFELLAFNKDPETAEFLVKSLEFEDLQQIQSDSRSQLKKAIMAQESQDVVPRLISLLDNEDSHLAYIAASMLSYFSDPAATSALIERYKTTTDTRFYSFLFVCLSQHRAPAVEPILIEELRGTNDESSQGCAIKGLANHDSPHADEAIRNAAKNSEFRSVRLTALKILGERVTPKNTLTLLEVLGDESPELSAHAARSLAEHRCDTVTSALEQLYKSDDRVAVRHTCAGSLFMHGYTVD